MAQTEVKLPELGENVESGDLVKLLVKEGDVIAKDQALLELETEKASIEVPSPVAGKVVKIQVKEGQKLKVGQVILSVEDTDGKPAEKGKVERAPAEAEAPAPKAEAKPEVVAAAPAEEPAPEEPEAEEPPRPQPAAPPPPAVMPAPRSEPAAVRSMAPAAPSVRRLAREIGVNIEEVSGTGTAGRITDDDVKAHAKRLLTSPAAAGPAAQAPLPDFSRWGRITREPMRAVRRATAHHLSRAWTSIPHVTQHDKADITSLDELRARMADKVQAAGGKLTMTAIALKIIAGALRHFPQFAASIDMAREEIIYKSYFHVGVAVDTERGLLVPVIRNVDQKNIEQLSVELAQVAEKARAGKLSMEEMQGGVFSITNLGGIGGTYFTPIVNWPEVAILGLSRSFYEPVYKDGRFEPRLMLPLSLSYDHRIIDGADAARFLRWVAQAFEQPFLLLLEG